MFYFICSVYSIVKNEQNDMDQDESVDDPVEDAALLDDSCEIKRDSICVKYWSEYSLVFHWTY